MTAEQSTRHVPVLAPEVVSWLEAEQGGRFLDCTLGGGGHARALLDANPANTVTALDRDARAIERARASLAAYGERLEAMHGSFSSIPRLVGDRRFRGILADLGLSTDQLFEERGFSFRDAAALDMRMDEGAGPSAAEIVNGASESDLLRILRRGGLSSEAKRVASAIVRERPISTAAELAGIVRGALGAAYARRKSVDPATVAFQAIRMAVNREIEELEALLEAAPALAEAGGRLAVLTYHSIEDRIVTSTMRRWQGSESPPANWPAAKRAPRLGRFLTGKGLRPSADEQSRNPSSRSARLRVFEFRGEN